MCACTTFLCICEACFSKVAEKKMEEAKDVHVLAQESYDNAVSSCPGLSIEWDLPWLNAY